MLNAHGITHALVNTGEVGSLGRKTEGPWTVGIQHPRQKDALFALARLEGAALATSGDYETFFTPDFVHNHIFDPATGRSPLCFSSVTVVSPSCTQADALCKPLFVLPPQAGLELLAATPHTQALFIRKDGTSVMTPDFPIVT